MLISACPQGTYGHNCNEMCQCQNKPCVIQYLVVASVDWDGQDRHVPSLVLTGNMELIVSINVFVKMEHHVTRCQDVVNVLMDGMVNNVNNVSWI